MAASIWQRIRNSAQDVLSPAEKGRALMIRLLAWLALIGFTVGASIKAETLLPPSNLGRVVWGGAIVAALILGIQAVYRLRTKIEAGALPSFEYNQVLQLRRIASQAVGSFVDPMLDLDRNWIWKLREYCAQLRHYPQLSEAIRRFVEALEFVDSTGRRGGGGPLDVAVRQLESAARHLQDVCSEHVSLASAARTLGGERQ